MVHGPRFSPTLSQQGRLPMISTRGQSSARSTHRNFSEEGDRKKKANYEGNAPIGKEEASLIGAAPTPATARILFWQFSSGIN